LDTTALVQVVIILGGCEIQFFWSERKRKRTKSSFLKKSNDSKIKERRERTSLIPSHATQQAIEDMVVALIRRLVHDT